MKRIAILSALAQEQSGLLSQLKDAHCVERAGREFWCGELCGQSVVLGLSRIGKVAAATTTAVLVEVFGVGQVIFTGVAGGVGAGVQVGDVVVGSGFIQHDMDASPLFPRFQIPLTQHTVLAGDPQLTAHLHQACCDSLQHAGIGGSPVEIHRGLVASGDRFVSGTEEAAALVHALQSHGHHPLAVEMEGAAVAQVCNDYGVAFAAMRTISDRADDTAHVDFPAFVNSVASVYANRVILNLLERLEVR